MSNQELIEDECTDIEDEPQNIEETLQLFFDVARMFVGDESERSEEEKRILYDLLLLYILLLST